MCVSHDHAAGHWLVLSVSGVFVCLWGLGFITEWWWLWEEGRFDDNDDDDDDDDDIISFYIHSFIDSKSDVII